MENQLQAFLQPAARDTERIPSRVDTHSRQASVMKQNHGFATRLKKAAQSHPAAAVQHLQSDELPNNSRSVQQLEELLHRLLAGNEEEFWQLGLAGLPLRIDMQQPANVASLLAAIQGVLKGISPDQIPSVLMEVFNGELPLNQEEWWLILQNVYASVSEDAEIVRQRAAGNVLISPPDQAGGRVGTAMFGHQQAEIAEEMEAVIKSGTERSPVAGLRNLPAEKFSLRLDAAVERTGTNRIDVQQIMEQESQRLAGRRPGHVLSAEMGLEKVSTEEAPRGMIWNPAGRAEVTSLLNSESKDFSPTSRPMVEGKELLDQVVKKMQLLQRPNMSEMRIQLKPEVLGKMMVKIMVEEGVVTARFLTENHQVRQLLEANMGLLRQSLEANGLKVDRTEVNVAMDNDRHFNQQERQQALWQQPDSQQSSTAEQELELLFYGLGDEPEGEEHLPGIEEYYGLHYGRVNFMV